MRKPPRNLTSGGGTIGQVTWCTARWSPDCSGQFVIKSSAQLRNLRCPACNYFKGLVTLYVRCREHGDWNYWFKKLQSEFRPGNTPYGRQKQNFSLIPKTFKPREKGPARLRVKLRFAETKKHRFWDCPYYEECLDKAIKNGWFSFSCRGCRQWKEANKVVQNSVQDRREVQSG